jgi:hypothetical protein
VTRLVLLPIIGLALLYGAHLVMEIDEAIGYVVLLLFITPSNMTIHEICRILKSGEKEMGSMFMWQYACLPLTVLLSSTMYFFLIS